MLFNDYAWKICQKNYKELIFALFLTTSYMNYIQ